MKNDLPPSAAVEVRAVDVGYFNTKYTLGRERTGDVSAIKAKMFPSVAPIIRSADLANAGGVSVPDATVIGVHGVDYLIGNGAGSQISGHEPRMVLADYCRSDKYHALMLGALNAMADHAGAAALLEIGLLVIGLPLTSFATHRDYLIERYKGEHVIGPIGAPALRKVVVREVEVRVQPHGAIIYYGASRRADLDEVTLVIDPGGGTLDWFVANGQVPNWKKSGAYPKGMLDCAAAIADRIDKGWRHQYDVMQVIDRALREGAPKFKVGTREFQMGDFRAAVDAVLSESLSTMIGTTGPLDNVSRILLVGGGARVFGEYLRRKYPELAPAIQVEGDPVFTNVHGFQVAGEYTMAERHMRIRGGAR